MERNRERTKLLERIDDFARGQAGPELQRHARQMQKLVRDEVIFTLQLKNWVRALEGSDDARRAG